ncbi:MAG: amidohydrolase family protein [Verrucomicrobiales bacterium]|nr:amidohydrolase family protein [Verrucomicrobiales bacterium]
MIRIDSHQHFWKPERGDYGWLTPELPTLYRDFLPGDLRPSLDKLGVEKTILVQAAPTVEETRFLLELAKENEWIAGVVGWVDFEDPDTTTLLSELAKDPHLVGIRPMVQDLPDDEWISRPEHAPVFEALIEQQLVFDALIKPHQLEPALTMIRRHPDLRVVIDHAAKPTLRDGVDSSYFNGIAALAQEPQVTCKLSGLVTEAREDWTLEDLQPIFDHLLREFGPDRLLWGSDWPVLTLAGDYHGWWQATQELIAALNEEQQNAILGGTAEKVYLS